MHSGSYGRDLENLPFEVALGVWEFGHKFDVESLPAAAGEMVAKLAASDNCIELFVRAKSSGMLK